MKSIIKIFLLDNHNMKEGYPIKKIKIIKGSQGLYYVFEGKEDIGFDIHFPLEWAVRDFHERETSYCNECVSQGSFNGVIVSYCKSCLTNIRSKKEKGGCLCIYSVISGEDINNKAEYPCDKEECCFKTYLEGINPWEIGDIDLFEKGKFDYIFIKSEEDLQIDGDDDEDGLSSDTSSNTIMSDLSFC